MKLTKEQAKMVIEFFSQKAAEEAPVKDTVWTEWDKHMWMTNYQTSLAIERRIHESDWAQLINAQLDAQTYDRDPDAYLHERGYDANDAQKWYMHGVVQDVLSASIDGVFATSKAA